MPDRFRPGTRVEVKNSFDRWSSGFEVIDRAEGGYRIRRLSDGAELPALIADEALRRERNNMWWV